MGSGRIRTGERGGPKVVRVLSPRSRMIDDVESGVVSELCLWSPLGWADGWAARQVATLVDVCLDTIRHQIAGG